ncbi:nickel/cobalt efflux protein RcnA [Bordetella genomosp. 9]|uniref:nickel/cobalt efflux transporter n=1 Tax=Bordetella genomosp. 9 TaxID=1416803 RepID=UPI000A28DD71|nr:nickel/cobalt efflux transporter [Bordetella genomosp. 9]ARP90651.1 nickel/cobalt efflux protein RcnA [Bordetella genomosp. 9]
MTDFTFLLQQGHAWLFIPSAILLGALHGLEPGHSKTMMAAFIIAIRGTIKQAILLGVTATVSHTLVVWGMGLGGMVLWQGVDADALEPYFQLASGAVVVSVAVWMFWRTWRDRRAASLAPHEHHAHHEHHSHHRNHAHGHDPMHDPARGLDVAGSGYQDAHQLAHANDIRQRFKDRNVTNAQIALFGLTGGLVPCPAAITILLLCLQLKRIALGATLVLSFSVGLAITLVSVGVAAALSVRQVSKRTNWFGTLAARAPYFSSLLIVAVGFYLALHGWLAIHPG